MSEPDRIAELVDLSLRRGQLRGDYHPPESDPLPPVLRAMPEPMPELRPGLFGLIADAATAIYHCLRKGNR
ncbi:hypothetical protein [Nocardia farcinica]|uniref:hypothetical protein n=1 Tax=Nocardia farcinica TaxID=37329 RepID=UPI002454BF4B|nr:hypothetical protein [Nocardia farcinica]